MIFTEFRKIFTFLPVFIAAAFINAIPALADGKITFEKVDIGFNSAIGAGFIQDREGFFWIGSQTGLIKWNGADKVIYSRSGSGLSDSTITAVVEDQKGQIWIGTMGGLNRYSKDTNTFLQFTHNPDDSNSLSHESIGMINHFQSLIEDKDGYLWIATQNGLNQFDPEAGLFKHFLHHPDNPDSLSHNVVNAIYEDSAGTLWVGTRNGLNRLNQAGTAFERYEHDPENPASLSHNEVNAIMEDGDGEVWIGTEHGLNKFDRDSNSFVRYFHSPDNHSIVADNKITSINRDEKGRLWLCHYTKGSLTLFDPEAHQSEFYIHNPENPDALPTNDAKYVYEDRQGVIWVVSTTGGNICKYDVNSHKFVTFKRDRHNPHSLNGNSVLAIYEDSRGTIWIGTDKSKLNKYDRETGIFTYIPIQGYHPYALFEDSKGTFWVGETTGRLSIFDRASETYLKSYDGLSSSFISHIAQDSKDPSILWLTTHKDGLVKFNTRTEEIKHFRHREGEKGSLSNNSVWGFWQTDDTLWLGTWGGGLNEFHKEKEVFTVYKHDAEDPESISSNVSGNLLITSAGDLYISTLGGGLNKFNKATRTFEHYSKSNGLFPADDLTGLLEDAQGNLWIASSTEEIIRFDVHTKAFEIYGPSDGIEIGGPWFVANHKTRDGQMWFGGPKGVTAFYPGRIKHNDFRPPVYITALSQGGEPIQTNKALERLSRINLSWEKPFFEFEAAALNYTHSEHNRYRYKLEGWDSEWFDAGVLRKGRYSNLTGGAYTLRIKASNNDGIWCRPEQEVAVTVLVSSPFWKTRWFYLILACASMMTIGFVIMYLIKLKFEISERKNAEDALRESESKYRDLASFLPLSLFEINDQGNVIFANPFALELTGYTQEDIIKGLNILQVIHPDDHDRAIKMSMQVMQGDLTDGAEYIVQRKDGSTLHAFINTHPTIKNDKSVGLKGYIFDLTEQKIAEEALRNEKLLSEEYINSLPGLFYVFDEQRFVRWNSEWNRVTGYNNEELASRYGTEFFQGQDRALIEERMQKVFREGVADAEAQLVTKDGRQIPFYFTGVRKKLNAKDHLIGLGIDITELKRIEEALRESNKELYQASSYLEAVIENANVWLNVVDRDGDVVIWNKAAEQISGYSRDEVMGHSKIWEWSYPDAEYREEIFTKARAIIESGDEIENFETTIRTKSNNSKVISWHSRNLADEKGEPIGSIALGRDVTATKLLEAELAQARKMESVGTMAGGIAHDFNNILFMITGNAELAMEDIPEWNPVHNNLKEIKSAGLRAADIVNQLLNFSRKADQEFKPIRAVTVFKDVLEFLRSTIPTTIEFRKQLPDIETTILGDPTQINQMMMNLCINASQAMEATGGILDIAVDHITLDETAVERHSDLAPGDYLKITISDTGPGIEPQIMGRIFDPYFTTKDVGKGSGMGLAVVHGIVKNHIGAITVDSQPGEGATFTILFPVIYEKPEMNVPVSDKIPRGNGEKILYVDDEASIAQIVEQMLERQGYSVEAQTSPAAALELFLSQPDAFDLVVTDMTMPQMTGVQLSEKLKKVRPGIPVIICSGNSALTDEEKAKTIGIDGYVMKPLVMRDIAKSIRNVLDGIEG